VGGFFGDSTQENMTKTPNSKNYKSKKWHGEIPVADSAEQTRKCKIWVAHKNGNNGIPGAGSKVVCPVWFLNRKSEPRLVTDLAEPCLWSYRKRYAFLVAMFVSAVLTPNSQRW